MKHYSIPKTLKPLPITMPPPWPVQQWEILRALRVMARYLPSRGEINTPQELNEIEQARDVLERLRLSE